MTGRSRTPFLALIPAGLCALCAPAGAVQDAMAPAQPAPATDAPAARQVLAAAIKAMGGRDAVQSVTSMHTRAVMNAMGVSMQMEGFWHRDGGRRINMTTPMGEIHAGSDGTTAWQMVGEFAQILEGDQARSIDNQASFHMPILTMDQRLDEEFSRFENEGKADFEGRPCWKIAFASKTNPQETGHVYFDADKGLPVGTVQRAPGMQGAPETTTVLFGDWKRVGDLMLFHRVSMRGGAGDGEVTFEQLELNTVDPAVFELPEPVRKLVAQRDNPPPAKKLEDFSPQEQEQIKEMLSGLERLNDPNLLKQTISSLESSVGFMPPEQAEMYRYVIARLKERLKDLGG